MSSLSSLSSSCDEGAEDSKPHDTGSTVLAQVMLGKRRRRRKNPQKESDRRAKRQKANPRKRQGSKRERIDKGKKSQAMKHAVQLNSLSPTLKKTKRVSAKQKVFDLESVKKDNITVLPWDGV